MAATRACGNSSIPMNAGSLMLGACHCNNCKRRTGIAFGISAHVAQDPVVRQEREAKVYEPVRNFVCEAQHEQQEHVDRQDQSERRGHSRQFGRVAEDPQGVLDQFVRRPMSAQAIQEASLICLVRRGSEKCNQINALREPA
ncbi:MAG: hypothetical protein U5L05_06690 [Rubrivivax sp.]|nr:hypothetical protein [Rubrivivax sp.]